MALAVPNEMRIARRAIEAFIFVDFEMVERFRVEICLEHLINRGVLAFVVGIPHSYAR